MAAKRHHDVPEFLLRRFSEDPAKKGSLVWRLDKATGKAWRVNPRNEAVITHHNTMRDPAAPKDVKPEEVLGWIDARAAEIIRSLEEPGAEIAGADRLFFALFLHFMKQRTPLARACCARSMLSLRR